MKTLQNQLVESLGSDKLVNEEKVTDTSIKKIIKKYNPKLDKHLLDDAVDAFVDAYKAEGSYGENVSDLEDDLAQMTDAATGDNYYIMNAAINPDFFEDYFYDIEQGDEKIDEIEDLIKKYNIKK